MRLNSIITWYKPYKTKNKKQNKTKLNVNPFKKKKKSWSKILWFVHFNKDISHHHITKI